ncbi:GD17893 [Drosophila simulans]|uniref:GD17893 n=1 Tax=Drosophila simulans TaxID=7240 RepID=B4QH70_DROSI|nr:GD17893 [Drosophila simulans]
MVRQYTVTGCSQTVMYSLDFQLKLNDFTTVCPDDLTSALGFQIYNDLKNGKSQVYFIFNLINIIIH